MTIQLPLDQAHPIRPPGNLRDLQVQGPVHRVRTAVGDPAWLVTGYRELQELFGDSRLGRSHPEPGAAARWGDSVLHGGPRGNYATEPEDHARFRARVQPHFSPRRMRELRPRVEALTAELIDQLAASQPPADLTQALALPLPVAVICELLGVPLQDREMFREWTQSAADTRDRARSQHGLLSLYEYGQRLVARKHKEPGDDIISGWCADPEVPDDAVAMLAMSLLRAGHETTVYTIGTGALMAAHPATAVAGAACRSGPGTGRRRGSAARGGLGRHTAYPVRACGDQDRRQHHRARRPRPAAPRSGQPRPGHLRRPGPVRYRPAGRRAPGLRSRGALLRRRAACQDRAAGRLRPAHQPFPPDAAGHAHRGTHGNRWALAPGTDRPARYLVETAGWAGHTFVRFMRGGVTDLARVMLAWIWRNAAPS